MSATKLEVGRVVGYEAEEELTVSDETLKETLTFKALVGEGESRNSNI